MSQHDEGMSDNTTQRKALRQLEDEPADERIAYYRKPFMVLWAAVQASSELQDDYSLSLNYHSYGSPNASARRIHWWTAWLKRRLPRESNRTWRARRRQPRERIASFPRLREGEGRERTLIDEVLDSLE